MRHLATLPASENPTGRQPARRAISSLFSPLLTHRRALIAMNLLYTAGFFAGSMYVIVNTRIQQVLWESAGLAFSTVRPLTALTDAYVTGQLALAIIATFLVNLIGGSLLYLTLPSVFIPFAGILVGVLRSFLWGILFSPFTAGDSSLLPHYLVIVLEGEAYIVAMLGVWLWWWPGICGDRPRWNAWKAGLRLQLSIYAIVALLLAVAAIYEALEVIYLLPALEV